MNDSTNKPTEGEGAKAPSSVLPQQLLDYAIKVGEATARAHFQERGNHSETHVNEAELAMLCAGAAGAALKCLLGNAVQVVEIQLPDLTHNYFNRQVLIHLAKDGTIGYLSRDKMNAGEIVEATMPVFSVDTEEQAKQLQATFGRLQYRTNPQDPEKPWYVMARLSDGTLLSDRSPAVLQVKDLPGITKLFAEWYAGSFKGGKLNG